MPRITLNGRELAFDAGATILDVARANDVEIPTLCWYPKLSTVANCRICLVSVAGAPKLVPACGTPATGSPPSYAVKEGTSAMRTTTWCSR